MKIPKLKSFCNELYGQKGQKTKRMCVLSQNFGNKVTFYNLFYCNSMRYSILYEINQAKLILELIIWSKRPKNAKKQ